LLNNQIQFPASGSILPEILNKALTDTGRDFAAFYQDLSRGMRLLEIKPFCASASWVLEYLAKIF
jgi:hypothetical protein